LEQQKKDLLQKKIPVLDMVSDIDFFEDMTKKYYISPQMSIHS